MKAKVTIELPPGIVLTDDRRAALVSAVAHKLGCGEDCDHDLAKANVGLPEKKLPHRAPQAWVDASAKTYEALTAKMLAEIFEALS